MSVMVHVCVCRLVPLAVRSTNAVDRYAGHGVAGVRLAGALCGARDTGRGLGICTTLELVWEYPMAALILLAVVRSVRIVPPWGR